MEYLTHVAQGISAVLLGREAQAVPREGSTSEPPLSLQDETADPSGAADTYEVVWCGPGALYNRDRASGDYVLQLEGCRVKVVKLREGPPKSFAIDICHGPGVVLRSPIGNGLRVEYHLATTSALFQALLQGDECAADKPPEAPHTPTEGGSSPPPPDVIGYSVVFEDAPGLQRFLSAYNTCNYEAYVSLAEVAATISLPATPSDTTEGTGFGTVCSEGGVGGADAPATPACASSFQAVDESDCDMWTPAASPLIDALWGGSDADGGPPTPQRQQDCSPEAGDAAAGGEGGKECDAAQQPLLTMEVDVFEECSALLPEGGEGGGGGGRHHRHRGGEEKQAGSDTDDEGSSSSSGAEEEAAAPSAGHLMSLRRRRDDEKNVVFSDAPGHGRLLVLKDGVSGGVTSSSITACAYGHGGFDPLNTAEVAALSFEGDPVRASELLSLSGDPHKALLLAGGVGGILEADVEAGKVVARHDPDGEAMAVLRVANMFDGGGSSPHLVTALTRNNVFACDLRVQGKACGVVGEGSGITKTVLDYALTSLRPSTYLSCHATTPDGRLAVGDRSGTIRLYSGTPGSVGTNRRKPHPRTAKTLLQGTGMPVRSLDITQQGDWLLAAYDDFLILFPLGFEDDSGKACNGFETRMGKHKPQPIRLTLDLSLRYRAKDGRFTKARFERSGADGAGERRIVAAIGPLLLSWNLDTIQRHPALGTQAVGARKEHRTLLDVAATGGAVMYITDNAVSMAVPKVEQRAVRKAGKFISSTLGSHRV